MNSKDTYNLIYPMCKVYLDNSTASALAKTINKTITRYIKSTSLSTVSRAGAKATLSRDDIVADLMTEIQLSEGKDKLAFITELNKLEDNYKGKAEIEVNITIIDYKKAVLVDNSKEEA